VRFVGIDLAWKCKDPGLSSTAVCSITDGLEVSIQLVTDIEEISLLPANGDCLVGIDASLKVPNQTGMRSTEKLVRQMGINILPTSLNYLTEKFGGSRGELLKELLVAQGFQLARPEDQDGRLLYEVFPYATTRCLMGRSPRYKHGRLADKKQECLNLLDAIREQHPEMHLVDDLHDEIIHADSAGIKTVGDKLDSLLSAISVYRHAIYRGQATQMIGDEDNGFILLCR
jgi:predicted RNase H-like nuclease